MNSQNGWPVLKPTSTLIVNWQIPTRTGLVVLPLRQGPAGFVLCHWALWFAENIEIVAGRGDDFGYADRPIAGTTVPSNHASATAEDLNSSRHPQHQVTFSATATKAIRDRLDFYDDVIRWGGDYTPEHLDQMHFEINTTRALTRALATTLVTTPRGKRLLAANPSQVRLLAA